MIDNSLGELEHLWAFLGLLFEPSTTTPRYPEYIACSAPIGSKQGLSNHFRRLWRLLYFARLFLKVEQLHAVSDFDNFNWCFSLIRVVIFMDYRYFWSSSLSIVFLIIKSCQYVLFNEGLEVRIPLWSLVGLISNDSGIWTLSSRFLERV